MKKNQFITLLVGVVAGLIFALGMCMCLLPEWNAFTPGVVCTAIGGVILAGMGIIALVKTSKDRKPINWKMVGKVTFGVVSALILGLGMCMTMIWDGMMIYGILVGIVGIVLLLCLIPMVKGLK